MTAPEPEDAGAAFRTMYEDKATDGLPIIPPTEERVEDLLQGTDLDADHVIGTLGSKEGELTVQKLAINGVMAGCRPYYMPILVAGARAMAAPEAGTVWAGAAGGSWGWFFVVNGPIRDRLNVNGDFGAFGPGYRANKTIPRALGLTYQNIARLYPGESDMSILGNPFRHTAIAENEEASPWDPLHTEKGYDLDESTVTLTCPNSFTQGFPNSIDAAGVLRSLINYTPTHGLAGKNAQGLSFPVTYVITPDNAEFLADAGVSRADVRTYLYENTYTTSDAATRIAQAGSELDIPPIQTRQFDSPDMIDIVVAGGAGGYNAVLAPQLNGPQTELIEPPDDWDGLLDEHAAELEAEPRVPEQADTDASGAPGGRRG
jgi:hypothetical protein